MASEVPVTVQEGFWDLSFKYSYSGMIPLTYHEPLLEWVDGRQRAYTFSERQKADIAAAFLVAQARNNCERIWDIEVTWIECPG